MSTEKKGKPDGYLNMFLAFIAALAGVYMLYCAYQFLAGGVRIPIQEAAQMIIRSW